MTHGSMRAVITAVLGNAAVTLVKFIGFTLSGSSALLAEAVHSLADTANQGLLYVGLKRSSRRADQEHHFGYGQERYFWNLVSAITIFFIGCVYTIMHAVEQIRHAHAPELSPPAFAIVIFAFAIEGYSFLVALSEFNRQRRALGRSFAAYFRETRDPTILGVLIEDAAAVLGLGFALVGMGVAAVTGSAVFDAIAAVAIGLLLGLLALFLAVVNRRYLINAADTLLDAAAVRVWKSDARVQAVHRVNSIVLSPEESVLMAELELREEAMFADMSREQIEQAVRFMARLDQIRRSLEAEVRAEAPTAAHIFIELVGLPQAAKDSDKR